MATTPWSRMDLAREICARLARAHGDALLVAGVYGSVARGADTSWSDLEMLVVARDGCGFPGKHLLFRGTAVGYETIEEGALRAELASPAPGWPMRMGVLSSLRVLVGEPAVLNRWLAIGRAVPQAACRAALAEAVPGLVVESYGRMHSGLERGNTDAVHVSAIEVLLEMRTGLCLLNGRWVTHDYLEGVLEAAEFPLVPEGYRGMAAALWRETGAERSVDLADCLVAAWWRLLERERVPVRDAQMLDELLDS